MGLFCILQAPPFWYDLRPDPVRSLFPDLFRPINELFHNRWVNLDRKDPFALVLAPLYLAVVAMITAPLVYLLRQAQRLGSLDPAIKRSLLLRIVGFTLAMMLVLLFVRGLLSSDIYNYAWYSRVWVVHGSSPYTHVPIEFPPDPEGALYWIGWSDEPAVYGPAWLFVSAAFFKLGQFIGGTFSAQLLSLRLLADAAHLLNAWLVWSIAGLIFARKQPIAFRMPRRRWLPGLSKPPGLRLLAPPRSQRAAKPDDRDSFGLQIAALLFYLWNPLLLVEFAGSGHNDVVMLTFLLLAFWLHLKGRWRLAAFSLGLATLVKIAAIIFVPGYLWLLFWEGTRASMALGDLRRRLTGAWRGVQALAILLAAWVVLYLPFWEGPRTLEALVSGPASTLYLHTLAGDVLWNAPEALTNLSGVTEDRDLFMEGVRQSLSQNLRLYLVGVFGLVAFAITWRARTFSHTLAAWGWVAFAAILAQGWFWPWYVSWMIVPAALAQSRRLRNTALVFTVSALLLYVEEQILSPHFRLFLDWSGVLVMAPPLVYIALTWLLAVWRSRSRGVYADRALQSLGAEAGLAK